MAGQKILIVEDDESVAKMFALKLNSAGFETKIVASGDEAIALIQKETFDLIVSDLMMAKMDGFTLIKKLRQQKVNTPIIVASALSQKEDQERALKMGANDYFIKSVMSLNELIQRVNALLIKK